MSVILQLTNNEREDVLFALRRWVDERYEGLYETDSLKHLENLIERVDYAGSEMVVCDKCGETVLK